MRHAYLIVQATKKPGQPSGDVSNLPALNGQETVKEKSNITMQLPVTIQSRISDPKVGKQAGDES